MMNYKQSGILLVCAIVSIVTVVLCLTPREPRYQGKTVSEWVIGYGEHWDERNAAAAVAVRAMGSNAVPTLLQLMLGEEPWFILKTKIAVNNLQIPGVNLDLRRQRRSHIDLDAAFAFSALGSDGDTAIPVLTNLLFSTPTRTLAAVALAGIGTNALPHLASGLTNKQWDMRMTCAHAFVFSGEAGSVYVPRLMVALEDTNYLVRCSAASALGSRLGKSHARTIVPALIRHLQDPDYLTRRNAAISLQEFGTNALEAVTGLLSALNDEKPDVRYAAAAALAQIRPTDDTTISLLVEGLHDPDENSRRMCADYLAELKDRANEAIKPLRQIASNDADESVRSAATDALKRITSAQHLRE